MARIRTLALGLAILTGAGSAAAAQGTAPAPQQGAGPERHGHHDRAARHGGRGIRRLFNGVNLTEAQKAQLRSIHEKYRSQTMSLRESMRPAMKDARVARQRGDTAAAKAAFDRTATDRTKIQALRDQQLAEVRALLTPEQRTRFDANLAELKAKGERNRKAWKTRSR